MPRSVFSGVAEESRLCKASKTTKNKEEVILTQVNGKNQSATSNDTRYTATERTEVALSVGHCYIQHSMELSGYIHYCFLQKTRTDCDNRRHQASKPSKRLAPSSQTVEGVAKTIFWAPSSHSSASRPAQKNKCQSKGVRFRAGYAAESRLAQ